MLVSSTLKWTSKCYWSLFGAYTLRPHGCCVLNSSRRASTRGCNGISEGSLLAVCSPVRVQPWGLFRIRSCGESQGAGLLTADLRRLSKVWWLSNAGGEMTDVPEEVLLLESHYHCTYRPVDGVPILGLAEHKFQSKSPCFGKDPPLLVSATTETDAIAGSQVLADGWAILEFHVRPRSKKGLSLMASVLGRERGDASRLWRCEQSVLGRAHECSQYVSPDSFPLCARIFSLWLKYYIIFFYTILYYYIFYQAIVYDFIPQSHAVTSTSPTLTWDVYESSLPGQGPPAIAAGIVGVCTDAFFL